MQGDINWAVQVRELGPALLRYFSLGYSRRDAADLVQEVLLRLVQKVESGAFDPEKGSLRAFAFGLAHWIRKESQRDRERRHLPLESAPAGWDEAPSSELLFQQKELRAAILGLPEPQREILSLLLDKDLTLLEIAVIVGQPVGTVKSHVHRAKQSLRTSLVKEKWS